MSLLNQIKTVWNGVAGAPYYTTIYHEPTIGATLQATVDAWLAFLGDVDANLVNELTYQVLNDVPQIESSTGELTSVTTVTGGTGAGASTGEALPFQVQGLIRWSTEAVVNGRRRRGRFFVPGYSEEANTTAGEVASAIRAATQAQAQNFVDTAAGAFVIYSPTHRTFSPVVGATMWTKWASLRSRRD